MEVRYSWRAVSGGLNFSKDLGTCSPWSRLVKEKGFYIIQEKSELILTRILNMFMILLWTSQGYTLMGPFLIRTFLLPPQRIWFDYVYYDITLRERDIVGIKSLVYKCYKTPIIKALSPCLRLCLHFDWLDCLLIDCLIWHKKQQQSLLRGSTLILRLCSLWLWRVCNLWSKVYVSFGLWFIANTSKGFVKYFNNVHKHTYLRFTPYNLEFCN